MEKIEHLAKRLVQKDILFPTIKTKNQTVTGLAGWNPEECLQLYKKGFDTNNIVLVDIEPKPYTFVIQSKIEDLPATPIMDCDYCASIFTSGESFAKVYTKMCELPKNIEKTLLFTFSVRACPGRGVYSTLTQTMECLNSILYSGTLEITDFPTGFNSLTDESKRRMRLYNSSMHGKIRSIWVNDIPHIQTKFKQSKLVRYADGVLMLSGVVTWN